MTDAAPAAAIEFSDVDILYGAGQTARNGARTAQALRLVDAGRTRQEIATATGIVTGVIGASVTVRQGEIAVLMGLSGSGKSTLLRSVNGLTRVTRGSVQVRHKDAMLEVGPAERSVLRRVRQECVAMVFQQFALLPWRTVRENVELGLELRGMPAAERRRVALDKLQLVGLEGWADRHASELSGGMQQRVGLARAFATDADILLMDEPFSALDPLIRTKLQDELLAVQASARKTILFVTHDLDEALKLGDQISIMEGGRIVQTGRPEDIVLRPANDYVREFVQHMNPLSVLTGDHIMQPAETLEQRDGWLWLDPAGRYRLLLDAQGHASRVQDSYKDVAIGTAGMANVEGDASLRDIIRLIHGSGHPVLLHDAGRFTGVCCAPDIIRALGIAR